MIRKSGNRFSEKIMLEKSNAKTRDAGEKLAKPWLDALKKPAG
jgi:hypothetical protein